MVEHEIASSLSSQIANALDLSPGVLGRLSFTGAERLPSCFPVTELAAASIGVAGAAISELVGEPAVIVDFRRASLWFGFSIQPQGWKPPAPWDALAGDYRAQDGWIKLHTNAPHHRAAALSVLGCEATREAVARAVADWSGAKLEKAVVDAGGCAARLLDRATWAASPQGQAVAGEPLISREAGLAGAASNWRPRPERPLAGLRVLDLTRVLAGPVATRFLAGYGAEVLRIDPQGWDEPGVIPEVTLGKRCARLDLREAEGRAVFERLLSQADILVHGYRADALDRLGYGADARQTLRPGLIDVSLDAYGHTGPWSRRRGFDSLVQFSVGVAARGQAWRKAEAPVSLPVQALDHATGYLMAAAAVRGLVARLRGEPLTRFRLSLARTADLLFAENVEPVERPFAPATDDDTGADIEPTEWGPAKRILPPLAIAGAPLRWTSPAAALGSSEPSFSA